MRVGNIRIPKLFVFIQLPGSCKLLSALSDKLFPVIRIKAVNADGEMAAQKIQQQYGCLLAVLGRGRGKQLAVLPHILLVADFIKGFILKFQQITLLHHFA